MTQEEPRLSFEGDELFDYISDADETELKRLLRVPALGAKNVILAELDRRKTQEVNRKLLSRTGWVVGLAAAAVFVAAVAVLVAVAVALHWGPF